MNCSYCYEREFFKENLKDITEETAKQAVDWLVNSRLPGHKARPDEDINICYFGGEPTLNWEVIKKNAEYCREIEKKDKVTFGLYLLTNGFKLPEPQDAFLKDMHDLGLKMQLSLDGCQKAHNTTRGHFSEIIENAKKIITHCKHNVIVRMTITPSNVEHLYESFRAMVSLSCIVNMIPIVEETWTDEKIETAREEFRKIMNYYQKLSNSKPIRFNIAEDCNDVVFRTCHAGGTMTAVTVDGNIYPCHRFQFHPNPEENWKMGDIWKGVDRYAKFTNMLSEC
ncbi:MAG: radical SAM protein, partial [Candidatus Omnitrophica bacterium]|nr:radical SAM protein [Candidatus Omnitrophota bacterium]